MKTRVTELLGIQYPIVQGGMMYVSTAELTAAVSNAGALGTLSALTCGTPEKLAEEIDKLRNLTDKPFAVNMTFLPTLKPVDYGGFLKVIAEKGVKIVETAGRSPEPYMPLVKQAGIKIIHKCTSIQHAIKAEAIGCDIVSIDGFECAGHPGMDDVPSLILVPRAADSLSIPVLASGGFGDGRGLVAALALGAEGVCMGTRFFMTKEAPVHENIKKLLAEATEKDTLLLERTLKNTLRALKNPHAEKILDMENNGATLMELAPYLSGRNSEAAYISGDISGALLAIGQVIGLIKGYPDVNTVVQCIVTEAEMAIKKLEHKRCE